LQVRKIDEAEAFLQRTYIEAGAIRGQKEGVSNGTERVPSADWLNVYVREPSRQFLGREVICVNDGSVGSDERF